MMAPLGKSVAANVFQADVERVVLLKFFEHGKIGLGLAIGAEGFFATVGDEVIPQTSPVRYGFVKRFLDPEERDVGDAIKKANHGFDGKTVVSVHQDVDIGKGLVDGVNHVDVALEAGLGRHPFVTSSDFYFELAVPVVVVPTTVFQDFVDAGGIVDGVQVVEVDHAGIDLGEMRLFGPSHCPDRLIEDDPGEVMKGDVDRVIICGTDASGRVNQVGDRFAFNKFEELLGFSGLPLCLAPTGRAVVGVKDTNAQFGGAMTVNTPARIAADLARPRYSDGPEFDPVNAMFGKWRVDGVREPRQCCGCSSDDSVT